MYKIGVIGDKDSVMGFLALGLTVFETSGAEQTAELIRHAAAEGYAALYITEQAAQDVMDVIDEYKDSELPAIILIPGIAGSLGIVMAGVKKSVEGAVGADILFNNEK